MRQKMNSDLESAWSKKTLFGQRLGDAKDVNTLKYIAHELWQLLDDISTLDDACRSDDKAFRKQAYSKCEKRNGYLVSDGYDLYLPVLKERGK